MQGGYTSSPVTARIAINLYKNSYRIPRNLEILEKAPALDALLVVNTNQFVERHVMDFYKRSELYERTEASNHTLRIL
jgi:hypothetical protein